MSFICLFPTKIAITLKSEQQYPNLYSSIYGTYHHVLWDFVWGRIVKPQWDKSKHSEVIFVVVSKALNKVVDSTEQEAFLCAQQTLLFLLIDLTLFLQRAIISTVSIHQSHITSCITDTMYMTDLTRALNMTSQDLKQPFSSVTTDIMKEHTTVSIC